MGKCRNVFVGIASAALMTGAASMASAAVITIDLTGANAMQPSFNIDLGLANYGLLEELGFTPPDGPFYLNVSATVPNTHTGQVVRSSLGMGVCSRFATSGACDEKGDGDDQVDGHASSENQGAPWEGLFFSLTGAPDDFEFILVSATFRNVNSSSTEQDNALFLFSGNRPDGFSFHIGTEAGSCTEGECTVTFNELGRDFEFQAKGQNDRWVISSIQWEIIELQETGEDPVPTPEPAMLGLLGLGLAGAALVRRRRPAA